MAAKEEGTAAAPGPAIVAARKRAAAELIARRGSVLRQVARRYSLCAEDAEDAYQRTLEILLTKAPSDRPRELTAWSRTVIKHEALAIRHGRERLLGKAQAGSKSRAEDWMAQLPAAEAGPAERLEQREETARSREALRALKPAELRALTLLAEGYSYAEIGEITGFSKTKVNRSIAEGRERFRSFVSRSEEGSRCVEMGPLLSKFCDGEASREQAAEVREHLRACGRCRATMRAYRAAPARVAALSPLFAVSAAGTLAGGTAKGAGTAALGKLFAVCAVTAGTAACVATGVLPAPGKLAPDREAAPRIERISEGVFGPAAPGLRDREATAKRGQTGRAAGAKPAAKPQAVEPTPPEPAAEPPPVEPATVESPMPEPAPPPPAPAESPAPPSGSAAGEFGP